MSATSPLFLGIDIGMQSLTLALINGTGTLMGEAKIELTTSYGNDGSSEQHPDQWFLALQKGLSLLDKQNIEAIAISGGAHIGVFRDKNDEVLQKSMLWNDMRSAKISDEIAKQHGKRIKQISLNTLQPTWTLSHIAWLSRHRKEVLEKTHYFHFAKDDLRRRLTGGASLTDNSDATASLLWDMKNQCWSEELCTIAGWKHPPLPEVKNATEPAGRVSQQAATLLGLQAGITVITSACDTSTEQLCTDNKASIKLASAGVISLPHNKPAYKKGISCYPSIEKNRYYYAAGMNHAASSLQWARHLFFDNAPFPEIDKLAAQAEIGAGGLLFHPYLQGERAPLWSANAKASLYGFHIGTDKPALARSILEGIGYGLLHISEAMEAQGLPLPPQLALIGGGAKSKFWAQMISDMQGRELILYEQQDASFGSALLAGLGAGYFQNTAELSQKALRISQTLTPNQKAHILYKEHFSRYKALEKSHRAIEQRQS